MVMERARRMVEVDDDVVVLTGLDLPVSHEATTTAAELGKIGTGGVDNAALIKPKKFFGSARNIEDGGS